MTPPPKNPHHPFVYLWGDIGYVGDLGDRFDADVWETRAGWRWSAAYSRDPIDDDVFAVTVTSEGDEALATEAEAVAAAVAWLRARCVETYGGCG